MHILNNSISLRPTTELDLELLFQFQLDHEGCYLAAFMPVDYNNKAKYIEKYTTLINNPTVHNQTICLDNIVVGSIAKFVLNEEAEVTYWIDRKYWGKGIASEALRIFLEIEKTRPLYGRVAFDNFGSQKVLKKCGFTKIGIDRGYTGARKKEIEEFIFQLNENNK